MGYNHPYCSNELDSQARRKVEPLAIETKPAAPRDVPGRAPSDDGELYRLLSEAGFEALAIYDRGTIVAANSAMSDLFGYAPGELAGMRATDLAAPESRSMVAENLHSRGEEEFRATGLRKDGCRFLAEVRAKCTRYRGRRVQVAAIRDLAERDESDRAPSGLEERAVRLVEALPIAILMFDATGRPRYANAMFERLTGAVVGEPGPEATTATLSEVFNLFAPTGEPYPRDRSPLVRALAGVTSMVEDMEIHRAGAIIPVEVSAAPVFDRDGEVAYGVAVFTDISRRRGAEAASVRAEAKYREIVENSVSGIFQSTPGGRFITANSTMARIFGYRTPAEMKREVDDMSRWYVRPEAREEFKRLMDRDGRVMAFVAEMRKADGSTMYTSINARAVRGETGEVVLFDGTMEDITERVKATRRIEESEERYRTLVETSPDAIALIDLNYKVTASNRQAQVLFGIHDEPAGLSVMELIAPEDRLRAHQEVLKAIQGDRVLSTEYELVRKDGGRFPAEVSVATIRGAQGKATSVITVIRDVTARRRDEDLLRRANAELDGYAHTVSHDLKNPLSAIRLAAETLAALSASPDIDRNRGYVSEIAGAVADSVDRAMALIEDLLRLAEAGVESSDLEEVDVGEIVATVIEEQESMIAERGVEIVVERELGRVSASRTHVYQVFSNLIGNALTHGTAARPRVEVRWSGQDGRPGARFTVRDNGPGVPAEMLDKVFLPFCKGGTGRSGIGLAIVERILKAYGGGISARNDGGAVFEAWFGQPDPLGRERRSPAV